MASRRIKSTINSSYVQPLKLRTARKLVISPNNSYTSVLFTKRHIGQNPRDLKIDLWAQFDGENLDGIHVSSQLLSNDIPVSSGNCEFKIFYYSADGNWTKTLIYQGQGTLNGDRWTLSLTQNDLGISNELDGERTIQIEASMSRMKDSYKKSIYLNHLGIYDSFIRLKKEVEFLDLTKKDE